MTGWKRPTAPASERATADAFASSGVGASFGVDSSSEVGTSFGVGASNNSLHDTFANARLTAQHVAFSYKSGRDVLQDVSADLLPGSFLAIVGINGCGKSTFLDCLDAVLQPNRGTVKLCGSSLADIPRAERAQMVAYVAQHSHANQLTVYDSLLMGRKPFMNGGPTEDDYAKVDEIIAMMDMQHLALNRVDELSGGEYQKMVIARAFVQCGGVLLLDEPTNNLDMANQHEVMGLVRHAVDTRSIAAAAVMHDINLALDYCDRFVALADGQVAAYGGPDIITPELIAQVYGMEAEVLEHKGRKVVIARKADFRLDAIASASNAENVDSNEVDSHDSLSNLQSAPAETLSCDVRGDQGETIHER